MKLTSKNFESQMLTIFNSNSNWLEVYKELKEICDSNENTDIAERFNAHFIYNIVKNKIDLEQFSQVVSHIYETKDKWNLSIELNDFFVPDDTNLSLVEYMKLDKYNNKESFYDNMTYLFLDFDKNKQVGKKLLLDKQNLPYLLAMTNEVTDNTIEVLRNAGYYSFIKHFAHNVEEIKPLIEMAQNNTAFQKSEPGMYTDFFSNLFKEIGHNSYEKELYPNQNKAIFKSLSKSIKNVDDVIAKSLLQPGKGSYEKVKVDLGLLNYCLLIDSEIDIISKINDKYKELYIEEKSKSSKKDDSKSLREYDKIIVSFDAFMSVSFNNYNFKIDTSKINIKKDFRDNYIYLKLIEIKMNNKQNLNITPELGQYIIDLFKPSKKKGSNALHEEIFGVKNHLSEDIMIPYLNKYLQYKDLDNSLDAKEVKKTRKVKV